MKILDMILEEGLTSKRIFAFQCKKTIQSSTMACNFYAVINGGTGRMPLLYCRY